MNTPEKIPKAELAPAPMPSDQFLDIIRTDDVARDIAALDLSDNDTLAVLGSFERFNTPVRVHRDDRPPYRDSLYHLRGLVTELPGFLSGARDAGLNDRQITGMIRNMMDSNPYTFTSDAHETGLWGYGDMFAQKAARGETVDEQEYQTLQNLIRLTAKYGVMDSAAYALTYTTRLGLSIQQAVSVIAPLPEADGDLSGYTFGPFNDALRALLPAEVNADDVVQVFTAIGGQRPYFSQDLYQLFERLVLLDGPANRRTPQALLNMVKAHLNAGMSAEEAMIEIANRTNKEISPARAAAAEIIDPARAIADYFPAKDGKLEALGLPYQTKRPLRDGLHDLHKIAAATLTDRIDVSEGMWVYDPASEIWYSLGGKLEAGPGYVRNNFASYDISLLSSQPLIFHTHPDLLSSLIRPTGGDGAFPDDFLQEVGDLMVGTPSRADYDVLRHFSQHAIRPHRPRAFIVHKDGITEYAYPNDAEQLAELSQHSRAIRDGVVLEAPWRQLRRDVGKAGITAALMAELSNRLPQGFSLRMFGIEELSGTVTRPE